MQDRLTNTNALASSDWFSTRQGDYINRTNLLLAMDPYCEKNQIALAEKGVCLGLACRYLIRKSEGKEAEFFSSLRKVRHTLDQQEEKDMPAIFHDSREVIILQRPDTINKKLWQGDIEMLYGNMKKTYKFGIHCHDNQLENILSHLMLEEEMILLSTNGYHAIGVYLRAGIYYLYDPNDDEEKKFTSLSVFSAYALTCVKNKETAETLHLKVHLYRNKNKINSTTQYPKKSVFAKYILAQNNYYYTMQLAATTSSTGMFKQVLKLGADPLAPFPSENPVLVVACINDAVSIVDIILQREAIIAEPLLNLALRAAIRNRNLRISKSLLKYYDKHYPGCLDVSQLFETACEGGNKSIVKQLLKRSPLVEGTIESVFKNACRYGHVELMNYLLRTYPNLCDDVAFLRIYAVEAIKHDKYSAYCELSKVKGVLDQTVFTAAIKYGRDRIVTQMLIQMQMKISSTRISFEHILRASTTDNLPILRKLLEFPECFDTQAMPDLSKVIAALTGNVSDCAWFMAAVNNASGSGVGKEFAERILLEAIIHEHQPLIDALRQLYVSIDRHNASAGKRLAFAFYNSDLQMAKKLLAAGVNPKQHLVISKQAQPIPLDSLAIVLLKNEPAMITLLKEYAGSDWSTWLSDAFKKACKENDLLLVKPIIKQIQSLDRSFDPLLSVLEEDCHLLLPRLINDGFPPYGKLFLLKFCQVGHPETFSQLVTSYPDVKTVLDPVTIKSEASKTLKGDNAGWLNRLLMLNQSSSTDKSSLLSEAVTLNASHSCLVLLKHRATIPAPVIENNVSVDSKYDTLDYDANCVKAEANKLEPELAAKIISETELLVQAAKRDELTAKRFTDYQTLTNTMHHSRLKKAMTILSGTVLTLAGLSLLSLGITGIVFSFVGIPALLSFVAPVGLMLISSGVSMAGAAVGVTAGLKTHHRFFSMRKENKVNALCGNLMMTAEHYLPQSYRG